MPDIEITPSGRGIARFGAWPDRQFPFKTGTFKSVRLRIYVKAAPKTRVTVPIDKIIMTLSKPNQ